MPRKKNGPGVAPRPTHVNVNAQIGGSTITPPGKSRHISTAFDLAAAFFAEYDGTKSWPTALAVFAGEHELAASLARRVLQELRHSHERGAWRRTWGSR